MTIEQTQIEIAKHALAKGYDVEIAPKLLIQLCEVVDAARAFLKNESSFLALRKLQDKIGELNENMG
jgi:hypothetical protein